MRNGLLLAVALLGCSTKPTTPACPAVVAHLRAVSKAYMGDADAARVLAACATWKPATLECLLAAKDDAAIKICESALK